MILPARTVWPPYFLIPNRFDWESRPFLVLPPAFLCAMANSILSVFYCGDLYYCDPLPVSCATKIVLATLELYDLNFLLSLVPYDCCKNTALRQKRISDTDLLTFAYQHHVVKRNFFPGIRVEELQGQEVALRSTMLLSTTLKHSVHSAVLRPSPISSVHSFLRLEADRMFNMKVAHFSNKNQTNQVATATLATFGFGATSSHFVLANPKNTERRVPWSEQAQFS